MAEKMAYMSQHSYERTQRELSNEYQHDRVEIFFKNLFAFVLWVKVASALEGLTICVCVFLHSPVTRQGPPLVAYTYQRDLVTGDRHSLFVFP